MSEKHCKAKCKCKHRIRTQFSRITIQRTYHILLRSSLGHRTDSLGVCACVLNVCLLVAQILDNHHASIAHHRHFFVSLCTQRQRNAYKHHWPSSSSQPTLDRVGSLLHPNGMCATGLTDKSARCTLSAKLNLLCASGGSRPAGARSKIAKYPVGLVGRGLVRMVVSAQLATLPDAPASRRRNDAVTKAR